MMAGGSQRVCVGETHILAILQINGCLGLPFPRTHTEPSSLSPHRPKSPCETPPPVPTVAHAVVTVLAPLFPARGRSPGLQEVSEPPQPPEAPLWSPELAGKQQNPPQSTACQPATATGQELPVIPSKSLLSILHKTISSSAISHCHSAIFKERVKADISRAPQRSPQISVRMHYI